MTSGFTSAAVDFVDDVDSDSSPYMPEYGFEPVGGAGAKRALRGPTLPPVRLALSGGAEGPKSLRIDRRQFASARVSYAPGFVARVLGPRESEPKESAYAPALTPPSVRAPERASSTVGNTVG
jgi:hypothetical protein